MYLFQKDKVFKGKFFMIVMARRKEIRSRGKFSFSKYFQTLKEGDSVAIVKERSVDSRFPTRIQGRTGVVKERRGQSYVVSLKDINKPKEYIVGGVHLKKIKSEKKTE